MYKYIILGLLIFTHPLKAELFVFQDKDTKLYGFKDTKENVVVKPQFRTVLTSEDKKIFSADNPDTQYIVPVYKDCSFYYVKPDGQIAFEAYFFDNGPDYYEEGLARFVEDGKVGFHDKKGTVVIPAKYEFATPFKNGVSIVCKDCWAEYDRKPKFKAANTTRPSFLIDVHNEVKGGKWGAIDKTGKVVLPLEHDSWEMASEKLNVK